MISYLMSHSRYIVCRTFDCHLKALNCFNEFSLRDRAMASLKLSQFRNSLGQAHNGGGGLFRLLHGCSESKIRPQGERAQSMGWVESSTMRRPWPFKYISSSVFHQRQPPTANRHGCQSAEDAILASPSTSIEYNPR